MASGPQYKLVQLANGVHSVHSVAHRETFHPVIGPVAEAEALYVRQLGLVERIERERNEFVIWDVGLGAAANAITVLRATQACNCRIRMVSFDNTIEPLKFALQHVEALSYLDGYESRLEQLVAVHKVSFEDGKQQVAWELHLGDFPKLIAHESAQRLPKPHAIMFDAFSPASNPDMWTLPLFSNLLRLLDPQRP